MRGRRSKDARSRISRGRRGRSDYPDSGACSAACDAHGAIRAGAGIVQVWGGCGWGWHPVPGHWSRWRGGWVPPHSAPNPYYGGWGPYGDWRGPYDGWRGPYGGGQGPYGGWQHYGGGS